MRASCGRGGCPQGPIVCSTDVSKRRELVKLQVDPDMSRPQQVAAGCAFLQLTVLAELPRAELACRGATRGLPAHQDVEELLGAGTVLHLDDGGHSAGVARHLLEGPLAFQQLVQAVAGPAAETQDGGADKVFMPVREASVSLAVQWTLLIACACALAPMTGGCTICIVL